MGHLTHLTHLNGPSHPTNRLSMTVFSLRGAFDTKPERVHDGPYYGLDAGKQIQPSTTSPISIWRYCLAYLAGPETLDVMVCKNTLCRDDIQMDHIMDLKWDQQIQSETTVNYPFGVVVLPNLMTLDVMACKNIYAEMIFTDSWLVSSII